MSPRQVDHSRERYPVPEGISYARDDFFSLEQQQSPTDTDKVQCVLPMWCKVVRSQPLSHAPMGINKLERQKDNASPTMDEVAHQLREYEDNLSDSLISAVEKLSKEFQQFKEDMCYSPPVQTHINRKRPFSQEGEYRR